MATPLSPSDSDWVIFYGITSGYALGPFCSNPGSPFPYSLGQLTDHPQQAIGWVEKGDAERANSQCGGRGKVIRRSSAIAAWSGPKGLGPTMGTIDWGTLQSSLPLQKQKERIMTTFPSPRRVTYSHPSLPLCGVMSGEERWDEWDLELLFFPDEVHHATLLGKYGYEPEAGLFLEGATVSPSP